MGMHKHSLSYWQGNARAMAGIITTCMLIMVTSIIATCMLIMTASSVGSCPWTTLLLKWSINFSVAILKLSWDGYSFLKSCP